MSFEKLIENIPSLNTKRHAHLIYGLIRAMKPQTVLEVGSYKGYLSCWMAKALQDNGRGELYCIDDFSLHNNPADLHNALNLLEITTITFIISGKSNEVNWPPADFVFIDGDHSFDGVSGDFLRAVNGDAQCIAIHDTVGWWGPRTFVEKFRDCDNEKYVGVTAIPPQTITTDFGYDIIEFNYDSGLAIFVKRESKPECQYTEEKFPTGTV